MDFPGDSAVKILLAMQKGRRLRFDPWVGKIPWRRKWQPTPVFLLGKFHGQRSLAGYSPWGCKELDRLKQLSTAHAHKIKSSSIFRLTKGCETCFETV